jgi:hypothetical protein
MSAQPLNSTISVYRTVRAQRNRRLNDSVGTVINRQRPLVMSVPSDELQGTKFLALNTAQKDFSPYGRDGFPIVKGQKGTLSFADAYGGVTGVDFMITIGSDRFLTNTAATLDRDLHADVRTVNAASNELSPTV